MEKLIAYRTVDNEGDSWCESPFLFKTMEDVKRFFTKNNPDLIFLFTDNYDEEDNELVDFEVHANNPANHISSITFSTNYAGDVKIVEMSDGYLIN